MKSILILICIFYSCNLFGQEIQNNEPFIIKGEVIGESKNTKLHLSQFNAVTISFKDKFDILHFDTTHLDKNGKFYLKSYNIKKPTSITLSIYQYGYSIYAAPGYDLSVKLIVTEEGNHIFKLTGKGAESYKYTEVFDSIPYWNTTFELNSYSMKEFDFLKKMNKIERCRDSIANLVFDNDSTNDRYLPYISKITRLDNSIAKLEGLLHYVCAQRYNDKKVSAFVRNNFDTAFFENPSKKEYLESSVFRYAVNSKYQFLNYLLRCFNIKDTTPVIQGLREGCSLEKVNRVFTGEVRAYILYHLMSEPINYFSDIRSVEDLRKFKVKISPYFSSLSDYYKKELDTKFAEREIYLSKMEDGIAKEEEIKAKKYIGKPAPAFKLKSEAGKKYDLTNFKGKVVILNLWSSWCDICRNENKSFNELFHKYENNPRIAFISIAVFDTFNDWKSVLKEDKASGIQLFDKDREVFNSYINKHVPKFILIDKQGNIANFMAPKPSKGNDLEKLIIQELEKQ